MRESEEVMLQAQTTMARHGMHGVACAASTTCHAAQLYLGRQGGPKPPPCSRGSERR